jgi:hypothetical protein
MVEARWRQLVVSSHDPSADEQIAEAIARVLSRNAVDLSSGVEVPMMHDGVKVTYVAKRAPEPRVGAARGEDCNVHFKRTDKPGRSGCPKSACSIRRALHSTTLRCPSTPLFLLIKAAARSFELVMIARPQQGTPLTDCGLAVEVKRARPRSAFGAISREECRWLCASSTTATAARDYVGITNPCAQ